ncbi:MAG TPA: Hsp20/alpha crystallin family protein [Gemmatimonadaceae bacterium]|jgi:HSP20 family protein
MAYRGSALVPFFGGEMRPLFGLRREIDRLFEDVVGSASTRWTPAVDVRETEKSLAIDVELPGIKPENVEVNVENGVLSINGEKQSERTDEEKGRYHMVERSYGSFFRSFQLPAGVDESQIKASFHDGVLTVEVPKAALPQPRKIQIAGQPDKETTSAPIREPITRGSHAASPSTSSGDRMAASGTEQSPNESRR